MKKVWYTLIFLSSMAVSCGGGNSTQKKTDTSVNGDEFPYAELPPYIQDSGEAMRYIVRNFWKPYFKGAEKAPALYNLDSVKFEDAYANYANALIVMEQSRIGKDSATSAKLYATLSGAQKMLFSKADSLYMAGIRKPLTRLIALSEKYLYNPNSPYLNEEAYIPALEAITDLKGIDETAKLSYKWQLNMAILNRVGAKANNFEFVYMSGHSNAERASSLHKIDAEYLLLYFNNPDCNSCRGQMDILMSSEKIVEMIDSGRMKVLSMYIDEDVDLWRKHRNDAPSTPNWIYARDHKLILRDNELYGIRAIPSMYLMDSEKKVVLKDAVAEKVVEYFR